QQSIEKTFTNARDKRKKVSDNEQLEKQNATSNAHDTVQCVQTMRTYARLFRSLGSAVDGKAIYKTKHEKKINAHAATLEGDDTFKRALKELWSAEPNKALYEDEAKQTWNIAQNQEDFVSGAFETLKGLCQYGHLGKVEMVLFYTFRNPSGDLETGSIPAHWTPENPSFHDEYTEEYDTFLSAWEEYAGKVLPSEPEQKSTFEIKLDANGRPRFPQLDLERIQVLEQRSVLAAYLMALWKFAGWAGSPAYAEILNAPNDFYDTTVHKDLLLKDPNDKNAKGHQISALTDYFVSTSTASGSFPFE
ncbi:hypothetical protein K435DRAFT_592584, partial [Dendrothele bispora CBS 962.96]